MTFWHVLAQGLHNHVRTVMRAVATLAIIIVPALYPLFYLQAFWNPYGNMENLPVAFVNQDTGDGQVDYGAQLQQSLATNHDVTWDFVDRATADAGLKDKTYYGVFLVPPDFSRQIDTHSAPPATIALSVDSKNSFIAGMLTQEVGDHIRQSLAAEIQQHAVGTLASAALPADQAAALTQFTIDPVTVDVTDVEPVANYGTGLAPYFTSLSLWIGALLISLLNAARPIGGTAAWRATNSFSAVVGRYLSFAAIGLCQAGLLVAVMAVLGIPLGNPWLLYAVFAVASLTSIAIVSMLISVLGRLGQLLAMVILIFQLTCSGGTFPTQLTQGGLFTALHPWVPFTYSIDALREVTAGNPANMATIGTSLGILAGTTVVCVAVSTALRRWSEGREARHLAHEIAAAGADVART